MAELFVIAGPNGAGKTTFVKRFLSEEARKLRFLNTDLIARGLSPFAPEASQIAAGKVLLREVKEEFRQGKSFCLETTLSGKTYLSLFQKMKKTGYEIHAIFLWLPRVEISIARVAERVKQGGHDVPRSALLRRFGSSIRNFMTIYQPVWKSWAIYDNHEQISIKIAAGEKDKTIISDPQRFAKVKQTAHI